VEALPIEPPGNHLPAAPTQIGSQSDHRYPIEHEPETP
jgi:hypothetical protein